MKRQMKNGLGLALLSVTLLLSGCTPKSETKSLVSHIKLDKKKSYHNNTVVGVDQIYLDKELIYEEDIYITKNKNKTIT